MAENQFFIDSDKLSEAALERKHKLETDPSSRTNHMEYMPGMEQIDPTIRNKVLSEMDSYDYNKYTARDVQNALEHETVCVEDFKALLSPAAEPFLERMAQRAKIETGKHFGNTVYLFTPLYIANYCENYCVYCGFNCYNDIHRKKLTFEEIEHEMKVIADSGIEEILMLTGESRAQSDVEYIGEACRLAKKYFRNIGLEIYPVNSDEYRYLHECGADYVTVFQETYDNVKYETLHLMGHKRVFPYRFEAQERALMGACAVLDFPHCLDFLISTKMRWLRHCTFIICSVSIRMRSIPCPVRVCARSSTTTRSIRLTCTKSSCARFCVRTYFPAYVRYHRFFPRAETFP